MLSEAQRLLISAFSADDLPTEKKPLAERLLDRSSEARALFASLQSDADVLHNLPRLSVPPDFVDIVMKRLPEPASVTVLVRPQRRWDVAAACAVAAVVFGVGIAAWCTIQLNQPEPLVSEPKIRGGPATTDLIVGHREKQPSGAPPQPAPTPAVVAATPNPNIAPKPDVVEAPTAPGPERRELASPPKSVFEAMQVVPPRLPGAFAVRALDQGDTRPRFQSELARGESHRLDVFCRDSGKAVERLAAILRSRGVAVQIDSVALELIKQKKGRGSYALFCEDLLPAEWAAIFESVAATDRRFEDQKPGEGVFDQLVLMPLGPGDQKDLTGLFGVDLLAPLPRPKPQPVDPKRPLGESTADQVAQALSKSDQPRPAKTAIVVAVQPMRASPGASREIKQFLDGRRDRPAGAVSAVFYFRLPN